MAIATDVLVDAETEQELKNYFFHLWHIGKGNFWNPGGGRWMYEVGNDRHDQDPLA